MRYLFSLILSAVMLVQAAFAVDATVMDDFVRRGDALQEDVRGTLRAWRYAGTVNTPVASASLADLLADFGQWKVQLEDVLLDDNHPLFVSLSSKVPLLTLYFQLVTNLVRIKQLTAPPLVWSAWGEQFALRVPRAIVWHHSAVLQKLWQQQVDIVVASDTTVHLRLKDAFVDGVQIATMAHHADRNSHLQAVKYLIYTTLYQQLVQNAFYRGEEDSRALLPQAGYDVLDLRQRVITRMHNEQQKIYLHHALLATVPHLPVSAADLQMPLIANWALYEELAETHSQLETFTTPELAARVYEVLGRGQKLRLQVSNAEEMQRFMLLAEHVLLPEMLTKNLQKLPLTLDGSDNSLVVLQHILVRSRVNAVLAALTQIQLDHRDKNLLFIAFSKRQRELQQQPLQATTRWYEQAQAQLDTSKDKLRQDFIHKILLSARHVANIEAEATDQPVQLPILRKALLHSLFVMDFSGEVQESLNQALRQQDYLQSRKVFWQEVHKHLTRLTPTAQLRQHKLARLSHDDIVSTYINPALTALENNENQTIQAIARRAQVNHIAQLKSLLQYGHWFGYFANHGKEMPTLDKLPLSEHQREAYLQELRFVYFDQYPFLLLEKNGKQLYQVLAAKIEDQDLAVVDTEEYEEIIRAALDLQYARIKTKMAEIDAAQSLQDIKHLAAGSPLLRLSMKEFDGLYPLHEEFVNRYHKPTNFQHNWEKVNMGYIGNFFMVMIGYHLGSWVLRRPMFGKVGAHTLSWLNPLFEGASPYAMPLLHAMWGVILFEYFIAMPYHTFVVKPQKLNELQSFYQLGSAQHNLINGTYLNYYRQERNGHFLNYALEMSMHALFVGWWVYSLKFSHVVPKLKENHLHKLLKQVGMVSKPKNVFAVSTINNAKTKTTEALKNNVKKSASQQIAKLEKANNVSSHYKREQIYKVETAEQKLLTMIDDKAHALEVAAIEHKHNFKALGLDKAVFDFETITRAYSLITQGYKAGIYNEATWQQAELAMRQLQMTLMRRLKISPMRLSKDKMVEETYQRALGEAVAESLFPGRSKQMLANTVQNLYQAMSKSANFKNVEELFEGSRFVGFRMKIERATPDEMRQLIKHIKALGYDTKKIKTLQDVRNYLNDIAKHKNKVIVRFTVSPGMTNDTPHKKKNRDKLNHAWENIEQYLKHGYFKGGGS